MQGNGIILLVKTIVKSLNIEHVPNEEEGSIALPQKAKEETPKGQQLHEEGDCKSSLHNYMGKYKLNARTGSLPIKE